MELKGAGVAMQFNHYQSQGVCVCTLAINSWSRLVFFSLYHACQNKYNTSAHTQAFHSFFLLGQHPSVYSTKFPSSPARPHFLSNVVTFIKGPYATLATHTIIV